jgi:hypothetical protein
LRAGIERRASDGPLVALLRFGACFPNKLTIFVRVRVRRRSAVKTKINNDVALAVSITDQIALNSNRATPSAVDPDRASTTRSEKNINKVS